MGVWSSGLFRGHYSQPVVLLRAPGVHERIPANLVFVGALPAAAGRSEHVTDDHTLAIETHHNHCVVVAEHRLAGVPVRQDPGRGTPGLEIHRRLNPDELARAQRRRHGSAVVDRSGPQAVTLEYLAHSITSRAGQEVFLDVA